MKKNEDSKTWMHISILLGVLLVVSVLTNTNLKLFGGVSLPSGPSGGGSQIDLSGAYVRGPDNAPVTIIEYSDFECPFCGAAFPTVKAIEEKYKGQIRIIYKHFPLSFHPQAQITAEASECAGEQGKFWEFHDAVFANQARISGGAPALKQIAGELGVNQGQFDSCLDSGKYRQKVQDHFLEGQQNGVSGTPTFFINGQQVVGAQPQSVFEQAIEAQLKG